MANILSVQSSARNGGSHSRALSQQLIEQLTLDGDHTVSVRDLADHPTLLDENWLAANWTAADERSQAQKEVLAQSTAMIDEVKAANVLVIGVPVYNFGIPGALKAWIDLIARAGETFRYSETGSKGLLEGKKAFLIVTSGGVSMDFATPYMRHVLGFIGIDDVEVISADGLVKNEKESLARAKSQIAELAAAA